MLSTETLEARTHFSVSSWVASTVSSLSSYSYYSVVQVGEDLWGGAASLNLGTMSGSSVSVAAAGWGWGDDGSFDSGDTGVVVTAGPPYTEGVSLQVGGAATISIATGSDAYSEVAIQAGVYGDGKRATWSNVVVEFHRGGVVAEQYIIGELTADTFGASGWEDREAVAVVSATGGSATKVVVSGTLRLEAQPGAYPSGSDVFGKVVVS